MSKVIRYDISDPRDVSLAVKYTIEPSDDHSAGDYAGFIALLLSAGCYLTRNAFYGALAIFFSLCSNNSHRGFSASAKDSPAPMWSGVSTMIFACTAVFSIYFAPQYGMFNSAPKVV